MEKYLIYFNETSTSIKYVETIYRNSISEDRDIGEAIEFTDKETALKVRDYLNNRDRVTKFKVLCVKTTSEEVNE